MPSRRAYVTLLTKDPYLPGVVTLNRCLRDVGSRYPLVVLITASLSPTSQRVLTNEGLQTHLVSPVVPQAGPTISAFDSRFTEAWTKLRTFGLEDYEKVVMIDSDMIVRRNIDDLFDLDLPRDWIAASHACACNPRQLPHYPRDWVPTNCAHTSVSHPEGIKKPPVIKHDSPRPYTLLNSGLVVLHPSRTLEHQLVRFLNSSPDAVNWTFVDQDLLAAYFVGRWRVLPYTYNALQPMAKVHPRLWRDEEVRCVHYIGPIKPWNGRTAFDPAYQTSNDWWWTIYDRFEADVKKRYPEDRDFVAQFIHPGNTKK